MNLSSSVSRDSLNKLEQNCNPLGHRALVSGQIVNWATKLQRKPLYFLTTPEFFSNFFSE